MRFASAIAAEQGAGTLIHVGRFDVAEFAVVLEPSEALLSARWAFYIGLVALRDALAAFVPAQKSVTLDWPGGILVDGGLIGGARLGWPSGTPEDHVPEWLVFGVAIRTFSVSTEEPGVRPSITTLEDEGFDYVDSARLVEGFARHLMSIFDLYAGEGRRAIVDRVIEFLKPIELRKFDIDINGDLLIACPAGPSERHSLVSALEKTPEWVTAFDGGFQLGR